jgi:hypothetical protein
MSIVTTVALVAAVLALIGGLIWAVGRISRKRGEEGILAKVFKRWAKQRSKGDAERAKPLSLGERLVPAWRRYKRLREQDDK